MFNQSVQLWRMKYCHRTIHHSMSRKVQTVLVDLSGTLTIEDYVIPGAIEALKRLRQSNVNLKFVTNTTKEPLRLVHSKLTKIGFEIKKDEIFTSLTAARNLVVKKGLRPLLMLEETAKEDFEGISEDNPNAVIVGLAPSIFNYENMNHAFRLLLDGAPLIAIHKGRYFMTKDGMHLGPGPFVAGLEYAAGSTSEVVGKPDAGFFHEAMRTVGGDASTTIMIGDDVRDDVLGAMKAGLMGILVKTGKYREGDETTISPQPTAVCSDFAAAVEYLFEQFFE